MNILVSALRRRPELLASIVNAQPVADYLLTSIVIEAAPRYWSAIDEDASSRSVFDDCFVHVVYWIEWEAAVAAAQVTPERPSEWVTCVRLPDARLGIALPQDSHRARHLSLFKRIEGQAQIVNFRSSDVEERASLQMASKHCGYPANGRCDSGQCGSCVVRTREVGETGLVCWCPH